MLNSTDNLFFIYFFQDFDNNYKTWVTTKRSAAQKEALKLNNLILEFINKSYLASIKKKNSVTLITGKNKEKNKKKNRNQVSLL